MSRKLAITFLMLSIVITLVIGCVPAQSELSRNDLVIKLVDAFIEEVSYATDIRVLNFISIDKTNLALYYYKVGQMEFEYLKYYWIKNNRVVLGGGVSSVINITEDDQLTVSGHGGFGNSSGSAGEEDWIWFVFGHCLNPEIRKVEVDFIGGETKSQVIDDLGGYIIPFEVKTIAGFEEIRGLDNENNILYRFPPPEQE